MTSASIRVPEYNVLDQSHCHMDRSRLDVNLLVGLFPINHSYNIPREHSHMLHSRSGSFGRSRVGDITYSKDVGVFRILELEGRTDADEAVDRVNKGVGRGGG